MYLLNKWMFLPTQFPRLHTLAPNLNKHHFSRLAIHGWPHFGIGFGANFQPRTNVHGPNCHFDQVSLNATITKCMREGLVDYARQLFDTMPQRNVVTWNSMIRGYSLQGNLEEALRLFYKMPERDLISWNTMITGCMSNGETQNARLLFIEMPQRDLVSWNAMLTGYVHNAMMEEAYHLFQVMRERNVISWNIVMSGLVHHNAIHKAKELFEAMPVKDAASWTIMVSAHAQEGNLDKAREFFNRMPARDIRSWNAMVVGYLENGMVDIAEELFMEMPQKDIGSWGAMINGYVNCGRLHDAIRLFLSMPKRHVLVWNSLLLGLIQSGLAEEAHALFIKIPCKNVVSWTIVMDGYFHLGNIITARSLFEMMPCQDETSWNTAIAGYTRNECGEEGLQLFFEMRIRGPNPDFATFTSVLNICSILPSLDCGKQVHGLSIKFGWDIVIAVGNAIVSMYARCGSIDQAMFTFEYMPNYDIISWNAIICAYAQHGYGREALELFDRMRLANIEPNPVTFMGVLNACCHAGLVREGRYYFDLMTHTCGLEPTSEHYTCMVDLLGRFGFLEEAHTLIERMRSHLRPSATVWGALLGACKLHGYIELGEVAASQVLAMEPQSSGAYLMLYNLYVGVGKMREAGKIWSLMKERGVKKQPGCSWIEVKNSVHIFLSGDGSHPQSNDLSALLVLLNMDMRWSCM
ncbi:pentatricopeptide repeat-containing protein At4g02750-like isoform X2 [Amborella trichopoda]|uniref:pentatricopeptide repeat-containing protein At4g02750-like isoform X2 n=1 Tax=Amborella trichopoda TaxID=13333 RepID=UPI0009BEDB78|nr:pentatricopeptide repeat-containing protein At4g02750-like isoform X2 [Amborella trichopoda]|eukprot:XP_011628741.2 pentatricopeptide repeat-containing protein At4g02750-like isoform X2 [Amborella trichopoda]